MSSYCRRVHRVKTEQVCQLSMNGSVASDVSGRNSKAGSREKLLLGC